MVQADAILLGRALLSLERAKKPTKIPALLTLEILQYITPMCLRAQLVAPPVRALLRQTDLGPVSRKVR